VFYKKVHRVANGNIRLIFFWDHFHSVKNDNYEKNHFNGGCEDPRNHAIQLQIDEKHRQWDWVEGQVQNVS
jgi:hypothetical protein